MLLALAKSLGVKPKKVADAAKALQGADLALLVGERVLKACIGTPFYVEKAGTWINVDGHAGRLTVERLAPAGVQPLERSLKELQTAVF